MPATSFQRYVQEVVNDASLQRARASRDACRLLVRSTTFSAHPPPWSTRSLHTGRHLIAFVCRCDRGTEVLVRIAFSQIGVEALEQQRQALLALDAIAALDPWRTLIPSILEVGTVAGRRYSVETVMPGVDGRRFATVGHERVLHAIAHAVGPLYAATMLPPSADGGEALDYIRESLARLQNACGDAAREPLKRLRDRLESTVAGRPLPYSRVHGDLWLGNAMLCEDGSKVMALVDWASSRAVGLPGVDLAHMLLSSRATLSRRAPGIIVRRFLDGSERLARFELQLLARKGSEAADLLRTQDLFLLAWLQHVDHVLSASKVWVPGLWLKRNVNPVLGAL